VGGFVIENLFEYLLLEFRNLVVVVVAEILYLEFPLERYLSLFYALKNFWGMIHRT